jgi:hypothetical protein
MGVAGGIGRLYGRQRLRMDGGCRVPLKTGDLLSLLSGLGECRPTTQVVFALITSMSLTLALRKSDECTLEPTTLMSEN